MSQTSRCSWCAKLTAGEMCAICVTDLCAQLADVQKELDQLLAEKEQWEPQWKSEAGANAAGYNEAMHNLGGRLKISESKLAHAEEMAKEWKRNAMNAAKQLGERVSDTSVLESRASGLDKAAEICRYHSDLPMRNEAGKAMARDIEISCLATAGRIRRGEYENPISSVMGETEKAREP